MQSQKEIQNIRSLKLFLESDREGKMHRIADFFPAMVYIYNLESRKITSTNEKFAQWLGITPGVLSKDYDNDLLKLIHPDDREMVRHQLSKYNFLKDNDSLTYTARYITGQNEWKSFRTEGMVFSRNEKGNAASFIFIGHTTNSEPNEVEELEASRNLISQTETLLQFGTWKWDPATDLLESSEGLYALLEYEVKPESFSLAAFAQHISEGQRERVLEFIQKSLHSKPEFEITHSIITAKGNHRIVNSKANCIYDIDGAPVKVLGVTRDITQQSRDHKELVDYKQAMLSKERFLASGSWEYDIVNNIITWSEGKYRLFGYEENDASSLPAVTDELFAKHVRFPRVTGFKDKWDTILAHPDQHIWEYEICTAQGDRRFLESYASVLTDEQGNPEKIIGATRDITRIREYEESLRKKIAELDRSNKDLEEFAYIASHDLQEPLRKITAFSERLKEKAATELSDDSMIYLDRMLIGAANMRLLIDNLLEFSRTSRHSHPFTRVDLDEMLREVESDLELKIEETDAKIIKSNLPAIEGIPTQIRQLFTNLLANSLKFRHPDLPIIITIHSEKLGQAEKELHQLERAREYFKIDFKDNGIGFEQEYSNRIFQIFQRLHGKSEYPGSGIGLAICKKIADNHHGKIFAVSEINQG
ncbi:MAG TPA: PAS domain-containing protein, partial [Flavitalea sp.]|nr:PAS domain-containing protein [Flavitalea sp.]